VGAEAELVTGGDVGGEVVDVEGSLGYQRIFLDGELVDFRLGFDGIDLVGKDGAMEEGELGVGLEDPRAMDGVGVGEKDEAVASGVESADGLPHRFVGREDVSPGVVELSVRCGGIEGGERPVSVIGVGDTAGLELVFFREEFGQSGGGIGVTGRQKGFERSLEIEIEEDFADVEKKVRHGKL